MGQGEIGADPDCSFVACERLGIAALLMTHVAEFIMRVSKCRELCKRELELCDSFVEPPRSGERNGVVMVHLRVVRQQARRSLVSSKRLWDAPGIRERAGQLAVRAGAIGPLCNVVLPERNGRAVVDVAPHCERAEGDGDCNEYDHAATAKEMPHANDEGGNDRGKRQIHPVFRDGLCRKWQYARSRRQQQKKPRTQKTPRRTPRERDERGTEEHEQQGGLRPDFSEGVGCCYAVIEHQRGGPKCESQIVYDRGALREQVAPRRDAEVEAGRRTTVACLLHEPTE